MSNSIYQCQKCQVSFSSKYALNGHMIVHSDSYQSNKPLYMNNLQIYTSKKRQENEILYYQNPKLCLHCNNIIPYGKEKSIKFCSRSCSATFTNKLKAKRTTESINKTKLSLLKYHETNPTYSKKHMKRVVEMAVKNNIPFSSVFFRKCPHCSSIFSSRNIQKYCNNCRYNYTSNQRSKYAFTFNVFNYPDLFDLSKVKTVGFYNKTNKKWNPEGLTRDHKISVSEAIKNNYDPFYIKHPLNCELMSFTDNKKKNTKCSIDYTTLKSIVDSYENKKSSG